MVNLMLDYIALNRQSACNQEASLTLMQLAADGITRVAAWAVAPWAATTLLIAPPCPFSLSLSLAGNANICSDDVNSYTVQWRRPICGAPPVIYAFWRLQHMQCRGARERRNIPSINFRSLGCNQRWRLTINIRLMYMHNQLWNDVCAHCPPGMPTFFTLRMAEFWDWGELLQCR